MLRKIFCKKIKLNDIEYEQFKNFEKLAREGVDGLAECTHVGWQYISDRVYCSDLLGASIIGATLALGGVYLFNKGKALGKKSK